MSARDHRLWNASSGRVYSVSDSALPLSRLHPTPDPDPDPNPNPSPSLALILILPLILPPTRTRTRTRTLSSVGCVFNDTNVWANVQSSSRHPPNSK